MQDQLQQLRNQLKESITQLTTQHEVAAAKCQGLEAQVADVRRAAAQKQQELSAQLETANGRSEQLAAQLQTLQSRTQCAENECTKAHLELKDTCTLLKTAEERRSKAEQELQQLQDEGGKLKQQLRLSTDKKRSSLGDVQTIEMHVRALLTKLAD